MILQSLVKLYEDLLNNEDSGICKSGWSVAKVSHRLCINLNGELLQVLPDRDKAKRGKKIVEVPKSLQVPEQKKRTSGVLANFLCDSSSYILGLSANKKTGEIMVDEARFRASCNEHHKILDKCSGVVAKAVLAFFDNWDINKAAQHPSIEKCLKEILNSSNFVFYINGIYAQDDDEIKAAWENFALSAGTDEDVRLKQCLVTGRAQQVIERLHPSIKGVTGAKSSGAALISFNCACSESYGCDGGQGLNAPVSKYAAFAYGTALNYLLSQSNSKFIVGDATVVFWSEKDNKKMSDVFDSCINGDEEKVSDTLAAVLEKVVKGESADIDGIEIDPEENFYILGLSPNGARVSVRFFLVNTFGNIIRNLQAHQERLNIIRPEWEENSILPIWKVLRATVNPSSKDSSSSPLMSGMFFKAVLNDNDYPASFYLNILLRVFADKDVDYVKAASIKAYLLKNHYERWRNIINVSVNEECNNVPYVLGRVFAVLEGIQYRAAGQDINATIKDRYFNSACATPASVFPVLLRLTNAHLRKLEEGSKVYYGKKLGGLMDKVKMSDNCSSPFPKRLNLEEQGAFILGYYQETQKRFTGKDKEN